MWKIPPNANGTLKQYSVDASHSPKVYRFQFGSRKTEMKKRLRMFMSRTPSS